MPESLFQKHLGIFSTFCNPCIFRALAYLELETYSEPCHSQNSQDSLFRHYSAIFRHIQNVVQCLHMEKPGMFRILIYS